MDSFSYQSGGGGVATPDHSFSRLAASIGSNIHKISQNVSAMTKLAGQLQTSQDTVGLRQQLRQVQTYTQKLAKDTSLMLIDLMKMTVESTADRLTRDRLSDEYITTLNAFQAMQRAAAQKSKDDVRKMQSMSGGDPLFLEGPPQEREASLIEMEEGQSRRQAQLTTAGERELRELEEREMEIRQLECDIVDVNQIFKELGTMIHDQGATVDSIESNVEHTASRVEQGTHELRQAASSKNAMRKKKVYLSIVLAIVLLIIVILIFNH